MSIPISQFIPYVKKIFFLMWTTFFKSLLNFLRHCFCSVVAFWLQGKAPQPGIKPAPAALEGKIPITGPPGKSLCLIY